MINNKKKKKTVTLKLKYSKVDKLKHNPMKKSKKKRIFFSCEEVNLIKCHRGGRRQ